MIENIQCLVDSAFEMKIKMVELFKERISGTESLDKIRSKYVARNFLTVHITGWFPASIPQGLSLVAGFVLPHSLLATNRHRTPIEAGVGIIIST